MHFGRSIYFLAKGDVLTVISPIDTTFVWGLVLVYLFLLAVFHKSLHKATPWIVLTTIFLVIAGVTTSHAEVILDGASRIVSVKTVVFYRATHYSYPFAQVQGASVRDSDQSNALRIDFVGGGSLQLTPFNQMGGKGQAAYAINQYMSQHGAP